MEAIQIAIDGPVASGKTTIAIDLAEKLGFIYIDTGAMYRALTLKAINSETDLENETEVFNLIKDFDLELTNDFRVLLDGKDVTTDIRSQIVTKETSRCIATYKSVRAEMVNLQRKLAFGKNVVMNGRDIGTKVLVDAPLKIFLTADVETRAQRRFLENKTLGINTSIEELIEEVKQRDLNDMNREESPLMQAKDAILLDSSNLTQLEVVEKIIEYVEELRVR